ncbi:MAG TPA: TIGR04222 domain-containing membrane protein, partial [Candidatus Eisenbacteria bacterium]|nr:TIGR04222 domain-containing membrane protein [Candidatus Eisenbacteria bacterium]
MATWFGQQGGGWLDAYGLQVLFLAILLGCVALLGRLHRDAVEAPEADPRHRLLGPRATSRHALLFPYEAAYLAGGPGRVVEIALASLLDEGWIASSAGGGLRLGERGDLVAAPDPVAISVLAVVAGGPPAPARDVRRRAARLREVRDVSGILYARRLVVAEAARRRLRRLRWTASVLLGVGGAVLLVAAASRSPGLASPPVIAAAAALVIGPVAPRLAGGGPLFRTAAGESELGALRGRVLDKAHWVAGRVWSDRAGASPQGPWA